MADEQRVSSGPCLEPEVLAAYVDRTLPANERAKVEAHLAACRDCYVLLTEVLRTTDEMPAVSGLESANVLRPTFGRRRLQIAGGLLAVAAALILVVRLQPEWWQRVTGVSDIDPRLASLVEAAGDERTIEARLTGGFRYGPLRSTVRTDAPGTGNLSLLAAAGEAQKRAQSQPTAESLHTYGVSLLLLGRHDEAVRYLEDSVRLDSTRAETLSDLGAAYLTRNQTTSSDADLPRALDAVERARALDAARPELRFNRALALEGLGLIGQAIAAYEEYLQLEASGGWADEARARLARLRTQGQTPTPDIAAQLARFVEGNAAESVRAIVSADPREAREVFETDLLPRVVASTLPNRFKSTRFQNLVQVATALSESSGDNLPRLAVDALLRGHDLHSAAEGLRRLGEGKRAFAADDLVSAERSLRDARQLLNRGGHPYAAWANFYHAQVLFYLGRLNEAIALLSEGRAKLRGHGVLRARVAYLQGLIAKNDSRFSEAAAVQRDAIRDFGAARETSLEAAARTELAEVLQYIAESNAAWNERVWTLRYAMSRPAHRLRHVILAGAARAAVRDNLLHAALVFQAATLENAIAWKRDPAQLEALVRQAEIADRMGRIPDALQALVAAQGIFDRATDRHALLGWHAELNLLRGTALLRENPAAALAAALAARSSSNRLQSGVDRVFLDLLAARAARRVGAAAAARQHLGDAIGRLEAEASSMSPEFERVSAFDPVWQVFAETLDQVYDEFASAANDSLQIAERSRSLIGVSASVSAGFLPTSLAISLPGDAVLLYFQPLLDRVLVWQVTRESFTSRSIPIRRELLSRLVADVRSAMTDLAAGDRFMPAARELYSVLFEDPVSPLPNGTTLIVVADPLLSAVPFGALVHPKSGRFLVQDRAVVVVPNASVFLEASARLRSARSRPMSAVLVGNPSSTRLAALPAADDEVRKLSEIYRSSVVLRGNAATADRIETELRKATLLHFGGHATINAQYPRLSYLQLAGDGEGENTEMTAMQLSKLPLDKLDLAVLAACETAGEAREPGSPAFGLAKALLVAGVPSVVGSLWKIDDRATNELIVDFHARYAAGAGPARALREAQLQHLATREGVHAHPYYWAGLQVYGGIARN